MSLSENVLNATITGQVDGGAFRGVCVGCQHHFLARSLKALIDGILDHQEWRVRAGEPPHASPQ